MSRPDILPATQPNPVVAGVVIGLVAFVFGVLYAWFVYLAVGNLVNVPPAYEEAGLGDRVPWVLLVAGVALPVAFYVAGLWAGGRTSVTNRVLLFAAGLAATAATSLSLYVLSAYLVTLG